MYRNRGILEYTDRSGKRCSSELCDCGTPLEFETKVVVICTWCWAPHYPKNGMDWQPKSTARQLYSDLNRGQSSAVLLYK